MRHTLFARWILVTAVFLAAVTPVRAVTPMPPVPTPQFRGFGLHEGLPSSKVKAVAQDARGFIWVATATGLARFDGVEFVVPGIGAERNHTMPAGATIASGSVVRTLAWRATTPSRAVSCSGATVFRMTTFAQ